MNQQWTLHVEDFARIKSADIEISPLMCFVGDNNSGKSYIMSLLWGILTKCKMLFDGQKPNESPIYAECYRWLSEHIGQEVVIDSAVEKLYLNWFNELLSEYKKELMLQIFNYDVPIKKLKIQDFKHHKKLLVKIDNNPYDNKLKFIERKELLRDDEFDRIALEIPLKEEVLPISLWRANIFICIHLIMMDWIKMFPNIDAPPMYFPASRTGFLLARKEIARSSITDKYSLKVDDRAFQEKMTAPYIQYLDFLNSVSKSVEIRDEKNLGLIKFIIDEITNGQVLVKDEGRVIRYKPKGTKRELPMGVTSSVVTEIAPLHLLLTTNTPLRLLIIEEPEAHLHPALQKKIAQLLIRAVHSDIPIWINTHSDTILHHFNNMIKLKNRLPAEQKKLMKKFNYAVQDLLSSSEINVYQFQRDEKNTCITKLESGKYGFVVPTFNDSIEELFDEIHEFQGDD